LAHLFATDATMPPASSSSSASSFLSRSVYLSHVRRAFLLRVHPDRFRNHPASVRSQQASLVQALSNRLEGTDVAEWQRYRTQASAAAAESRQAAGPPLSLPFILERRDGSYLTSSLQLGDSVESILKEMVGALEKSGAASLPPPPSLSAPLSNEDEFGGASHRDDDPTFSSSSSSSSSLIDRRYEVNSLQGRNLVSFLSDRTPDALRQEIRRRKQCRVHAQASAAEVRKRYEFLLVDATSLRWSSESVAVLLNKLLALHDEHQAKLKAKSMYPIQLQLTTASLSADGTPVLDVHGGVLRLHPAATPLQWLESLQLVTDERLQQIRRHQRRLRQHTEALSSALGGVKLIKGHSCSSREYHAFVENLYESLVEDATTKASSSTASESRAIEAACSALALEPVVVTVEASQAVRTAKVTPEGHVRVQTGMAPAVAASAIRALAPEARAARHAVAARNESCARVVAQLQYRLGLSRVYRATARVPAGAYLKALSRLLNLAVAANSPTASARATAEESSHNDVRLLLQRTMAGNSIGIAASGHFCHLGDDGSFVIPHDWR
jgi:uncharacterized protein YejL (UPF0352 family)